MIIVDTNVISELMRPKPNRDVVTWFDQQSELALYTSAITEAEIRYGAGILPQGKRKTELLNKIQNLFAVHFESRVLPFDSAAAQAYAVIHAHRVSIGRPISQLDAQIAAIAASRGAAVATRNINDFTDCDIALTNPWD